MKTADKFIRTIILLFATVLTFVACNSDDNASQSNSERIIGKWKLTHSGTVSSDGEEHLMDMEGLYCNEGYSMLEFKTDGTFIWITPDAVGSNDCTSDIITGNWSVNGTVLTYTNGLERTDEILILDNTTLKTLFVGYNEIYQFNKI